MSEWYAYFRTEAEITGAVQQGAKYDVAWDLAWEPRPGDDAEDTD